MPMLVALPPAPSMPAAPAFRPASTPPLTRNVPNTPAAAPASDAPTAKAKVIRRGASTVGGGGSGSVGGLGSGC